VQIFRQQIKKTKTTIKISHSLGLSYTHTQAQTEVATLAKCQIKAHLTFLAPLIRLVGGKPKLGIIFLLLVALQAPIWLLYHPPPNHSFKGGQMVRAEDGKTYIVQALRHVAKKR